MKFLGRGFACLLTVSSGLIGGVTAAAWKPPPGVSTWDFPQHLLQAPMPDPRCYPGYNQIPDEWDSDNYHPLIKELRDLIENNEEYYQGFIEMFDQIPHRPRYELDTNGFGPLIRDYQHALYRLNLSLTWSPIFGGTDVYAFSTVFYWPGSTVAGFRMFTNDRLNELFGRQLSEWAKWLSGPDSRCSLSEEDGGWFSPDGLKALEEAAGGKFEDVFECNPAEEYWGYQSWDHFFTRKFRDIERDRPVDGKGDDSIIVCPSELNPYVIARDIKERDTFWIKEEPYSVRHILNDDPLTHEFIGGTMYQGYLAPTFYHGFHSPVTGRIVKTVVVPGAYYAISSSWVFSPEDPDPDLTKDGNWSQKFLTSVAGRTLFYIQADNPDIGLMVFMVVGMGECSSVEVLVKDWERVEKGQQIGTFHFGGSSTALLFRKEVNIEFDTEPVPVLAPKVDVNRRVARVHRRRR